MEQGLGCLWNKWDPQFEACDTETWTYIARFLDKLNVFCLMRYKLLITTNKWQQLHDCTMTSKDPSVLTATSKTKTSLFSQPRNVVMTTRMLTKRLMISNGTTRHMAIKQWWWDNEIFHFRHLQFEISPCLSSWKSSNAPDWEGGIIYWILLLRTNISLPLESQQVSELYQADHAMWNRTAEAKGNATELNRQHPSNGSIKEAKAMAFGFT